MIASRDARQALDCVIVGGGPAGLTAATYLGRFKRRVALIDAGRSRLLRVPMSRNVPGFPEGISGRDLYERLLQQAELYGVLFVEDEVTGITKAPEGFEVQTGAATYLAKMVILATGVAVTDPAMPGIEDAIAAAAVRYCPICDGFEAEGKRIAVLGARPGSIHEAFFLRTYSDDVTFLRAHARVSCDPHDLVLAKQRGIKIETSVLAALERVGGEMIAKLGDGRRLRFDAVYPCLGAEPRSQLLVSLGGAVSESGGILTDRHQETSVPGIMAAGDVLEGLDQIASACGQAAIAATTIHNRLNARETDGG